MQEIVSGVYVGSRQDAEKVDGGFALVVNCTVDTPHVRRRGVKNVRLPVPDGRGGAGNAVMSRYLPGIVEEMIRTVKPGMGKVLVHCDAGRSQAVSVAVAFLVAYRGYSMKDSRLMVWSRYPEASRHEAFREALEGFCAAHRASSWSLSDVLP